MARLEECVSYLRAFDLKRRRVIYRGHIVGIRYPEPRVQRRRLAGIFTSTGYPDAPGHFAWPCARTSGRER